MKLNKSMCLWAVMMFIAAALLSCSGGGGNSSSSSKSDGSESNASSLTLAERISIVDAQSSSTSGRPSQNITPLKADFRGITLTSADVPSGTPYFTDPEVVWVEDRTLEAFDVINEVLCMIDLTAYESMLNKGYYKALVDQRKCSSRRDQGGSSNQSSASTKPNYSMWSMKSERTSNASPQIIETWIHMPAEFSDDTDQIIHARATITEGKSASNPYGVFTIHFAAYDQHADGTANLHTRKFMGYMKAESGSTDGEVVLSFVEDEWQDANNFAYRQSVLRRGSGGLSGSGRIVMDAARAGVPQDVNYKFAFDTANMLRNDGAADVCLDRNNFNQTTWRYGLYRADGQRLLRNSGFPIRTLGSDHGWIGYYGMWFPNTVSISGLNGATVYKEDYAGGSATLTPYTAVVSGGRLVKHTKGTIQLTKIANIPLEYYDNTAGNSARAIWNPTTVRFEKVSTFDSTTGMWTAVAAAPIDLTGMYSIFFWSQSLGGNIRVDLTNPTTGAQLLPTNSTVATTYSDDIIYPDQLGGDFTLMCFRDCLDAGELDTLNNANIYYTNSRDGSLETEQAVNPTTNPAGISARRYTFTKSTMMLSDNSELVANADVTMTSANTNYSWGAWTGPMIAQTDASQLACNYDATKTCPWQVWDSAVYYTWETGPETWNMFTGLRDSSGNFVVFDAPLKVKYTHSQTDATAADYKYNNIDFLLEYNGFGDLWGVPGKCVDMDSGLDVACGASTRWVPEFNIPGGSQVTDDSSISYLTKSLEREERMKQVAAASCSVALSTTITSMNNTTHPLPDIIYWQDPALGIEPASLRDAAPAVIDGILQ